MKLIAEFVKTLEMTSASCMGEIRMWRERNVRKMDSKITDHPGKEKIRKRERHERNEADKTSGDISEGAQVKQ